MIKHPLFAIRQTHRYGFRSGMWAACAGVIGIEDSDSFDGIRPCYVVVFPDEIVDYWPVNDEDAWYEYGPLSKVAL